LLGAAAFIVVIGLVGAPLIAVLLGDRYTALGELMVWMGLLQGIRVFKAGPATVALSIGQTSNALLSNLVRVAMLPLAWYVAVSSGDLRLILWLAIGAEMIGHLVAVMLLWRRAGIDCLRLFTSHIGVAAICLSVTAYALLHPPFPVLRLTDLWACLGLCMLMLLVFLDMRELRASVIMFRGMPR
jgi:hypothetical protein